MELAMTNRRVLIVSESDLFVDALSRLLQEAGISVMGRANQPEDARAFLNAQQIDTVVVDYDDRRFRDAEVVAQLINNDEERQVVFLTMVGNKMIVHQRERIENVTPADLIRVIRLSPKKSSS
jgi:DNA-binding NarL/FixJ family response regulator